MHENTLHPYQQADMQAMFEHIEAAQGNAKLLYQLPTGGGKTVIFTEIAKRYCERFDKTVAILTHRRELCRQTAATLKKRGVKNRVIDSSGGDIGRDCTCYVAMVETLRNRIKSKKVATTGIGLVIIDEAHHNSFRKLLKHFSDATIIGVTATPFSADVSKPMNRYYQTLVTGKNISELITDGFLAKPKTVAVEVELNSLSTGPGGDYTVGSSDALYGSPAMLELLLDTYRSHSAGKKTLIFNNGIDSSLKVCHAFEQAGIPIRHLDNRTPAGERAEILQWFKKTKGAVLTSVSLLTTGFDEPTVQTVILNRATTSITLFHQMAGRGARRLPAKKTFTLIDLGKNIARFGHWQDPVDWKFAFERPEAFARQFHYTTGSSQTLQSHGIAGELRAQFPHTLEMAFDIEGHYQEAVENDKKPKTVIQQSIRQHAAMCLDNAESLSGAVALAKALQPEIEWRIKQYVKCLGRASKSYKAWLVEDYGLRLESMVQKLYARLHP